MRQSRAKTWQTELEHKNATSAQPCGHGNDTSARIRPRNQINYVVLRGHTTNLAVCDEQPANE